MSAASIVSEIATTSSKMLSGIAEINDAHRKAQACAADAVKHAIRCGELLIKQKATLAHGEFQGWVKVYCVFAYSTAARYMKAAEQSSTGVEICSLSALFLSGRGGTEKTTRSPVIVENTVALKPSTTPRTPPSASPSLTSCASNAQPPQPEPAPISVESALKALKEAALAREIAAPRCVGNFSAVRGRVTKLRNDLAKAEQDLEDAETEILAAYQGLAAVRCRSA